MKIKVKFHSKFKDVFATDQMEVELDDGAKVHDLLRLLCHSEERRKSLFSLENTKLRHDVMVARNGLFILYLNRLNTPLHKGDTLTIFYPASMG